MTNVSWLSVDEIVVGERFRKDLGDIQGLADSIKELGIIEPLVVTPTNRLLAGQRRLHAAKQAGLKEVPVFVKETGDDEITERKIEDAENERRKGFTATERTEIAEAIRKLISDGKLQVPEGVRRDQFIAEKSGFESETQMARAKAVQQKGAEELIKAVDEGKVTISAAADLVVLPKEEQVKAVKEGKVKEKASEVRKEKAATKPKKKPEPVNESKDDGKGDSEQLDGLGNPIPDCVADTFGDRDLVETIAIVKSLHQDLVRLSNQLQGRISQKCGEFWRFVQCGEALKSTLNARDQIANAFRQLEVGVPFCVCPHCDGKGCAQCRQSGYWPKERYDNREQYEV